MNRSFIITEEDRKRILGLHQNATKNQYLKIISEATSHSESVEPYKPSDEEIEKNIKNDPEIWPKADWKPCLAKMAKNKGWYKGKLGFNDNNGDPKAEAFWTPSKTSGSGMLMYVWWGKLYKQTGDTIEEYVVLRDFNCNEPPFVRIPAKTEEEITSGKRNLQINDDSPMVTTLIQLLKKSQQLPDTKEEGTKFDKEVRDAVIKFQTVNNLKKDGIVGKNTWKRLSEVSAGSVNSGNFEKSAENVFNKTLPKFDSNIGNEPSAEQIANVKAMKGFGNKDTGTQNLSFDSSNLNQAGAEDKGTSKNMSEW